MVFNNSPRVVWSGSGSSRWLPGRAAVSPASSCQNQNPRQRLQSAEGTPGPCTWSSWTGALPLNAEQRSTRHLVHSAIVPPAGVKIRGPPPAALAQQRHLTEFDTRKYDKLINPKKNLLFAAFSNQRAEMENTVSTDG